MDKSNEYLFPNERDENDYKFINEVRTNEYNINGGEIYSFAGEDHKNYYNFLAKNSDTYDSVSLINGEFVNDSFGNHQLINPQKRTPLNNKSSIKHKPRRYDRSTSRSKLR